MRAPPGGDSAGDLVEAVERKPGTERVTLGSRFVDTRGFRIHYRFGRRLRDRPTVPIVCVHGLVVSSLYMIPLAEHLARDFDVFAPDLPGFGDSEKPPAALSVPELADALLDFMDAIGLERPALIGNSMGCQIIAELAVRHPQRVDRLILNGLVVDPRENSAPRQMLRLFVDAWQERWALGLIHVRDYARAGLGRALRTFRSMLRYRIERTLPLVTVPALVIRGSRDTIATQRWAEEATNLLPHGRLKVIPGAAHATNYDAPLEMARVSRPFLLESSAGRG